MRLVSSMDAIDDKSFEIRLRQPFPLLLDALAKPGSNVPFIMPERLAKIDAGEQIKEVIGSGPFKFVDDEWIPGIKVVYAKNTDYVPRKEPPSWTAGGKVVKVDRVEWQYVTDVATAHAALISGEVDWWEQPPADILSVLRGSRGIRVENIDALGSIGMIRFNHLVPPFDNPKMRQALLHVINQKDYLLAIAGDAKNGKICMSYFTCGTPMANEAGAEVLKARRDLEKAKQLIQEAGYNGERIVILSATDQPIVHSQGLVTTELLGSLGLNVELQASDWGTLLQRRAIRKPVEEGGWSMFHTWWGGTDLTDPAVNAAIRGNGEAGWYGWAKDEELEALRNKWFEAPNADEQKKIAMAMQARAFDVVPAIPTAQFVLPTAYRSNITGVLDAPITVMWNVDKK
jgi:peptide/nickel transport system substrate-binding protein